MITIAKTDCNFEREPLRAPFGFKGGFLTEIWQSVAGLRSDSGHQGVGIASQSVLWSDETVFARNSESAGNGLMFQLTAHALRLCAGRSFERPEELLDQILPEVLAFGRTITGNPHLRPTFALNALVAVDNAAWQLFAAARGASSLDVLAESYHTALPCRHREIAVIPLISYAVTVEQAVAFARSGHPLLKIKIGSDPARNGDRAKMLEWDCARVSEIHAAVRDTATSHTTSGHIAYYLDANGHYDSKDRLMRLLDHCERIGALEHVVLLEEPFAEEFECDVRDAPVRVAADESAHSVADVAARIDAGYGAIALKPVAKTLSVSLRMAAAAQVRGVPCFCADLTVTPILVDWGKIVAARLERLPGLSVGVLETNGAQNYRDWERLESYHPRSDAPWTKASRGLFSLTDAFFVESGGIFKPSTHYAGLVPGVLS